MKRYILLSSTVLVPLFILISLVNISLSSVSAKGAYVVNSTLDATDTMIGDGVCETGIGNGICTLRAAVQETNAQPTADTIIVPAGIYTLTITGADENLSATGDLDLLDDVIIMGESPTNTIIFATGTDRVFDTYDENIFGSVSIFTIANLTLRNGNPPQFNTGGGAVANWGTMTLDNVILTDNHAVAGGGAVGNRNRLTIQDSLIQNNTSDFGGGALYNILGPQVTIIRTTLQNNQALARQGGAIYNRGGILDISYTTLDNNATLDSRDGGAIFHEEGVLLISDSLISNNSSTDRGGGIALFADATAVISNSLIIDNQADFSGGGIYAWSISDKLTLINSTVTGNSADGAGRGLYLGSNQGTIIRNSTIVSNTTQGGGVYFADIVTMTNSIIAFHHGTNNCAGSFWLTLEHNNIEDSDSCGFVDPTDFINTDPQLAALGDNGGATLTFALRPASPAIDSGDNLSCPPTDQRGILRPQDGNGNMNAVCDIGSFEYMITNVFELLLPIMVQN